jgi:hypothetical protein
VSNSGARGKAPEVSQPMGNTAGAVNILELLLRKTGENGGTIALVFPMNQRITSGASLTARLTRSGLRWITSGTLTSKPRRGRIPGLPRSGLTWWPPCPGIRGTAPAPIPGAIALPEAPDSRAVSGA